MKDTVSLMLQYHFSFFTISFELVPWRDLFLSILAHCNLKDFTKSVQQTPDQQEHPQKCNTKNL